MKNTVSVIINFHNGEKYLATCIESVLNQKFENLEIILWDNASTDNSKNIVKKFQEKKIKYFRHPIKEFVINKDLTEQNESFDEIEKRIVQLLEDKIRPAIARDGGDIKFKEFKDGVVKVQLQGSCSGCPSSTMTLKQGVQNLLCHYLPEVKKVEAI